MRTIGLIAGNGVYPLTFAKAARRAGVSRLVAAAFHGETDTAVVEAADEAEWFRVGQLSRMIRFFRDHGVSEAVMAGQIAPRNLFELRPDMRTLVMIGRLKRRSAETLFAAVAGELERDGIRLLPATTFLDDLLPAAGHVFGPKLDRKQEDDARFGFRIAKETSRLDIGQTVVVKRGAVLAVEAFEGTDEAVRRGGKLGRGHATMAKVSKPNQDFRFDVPVVGAATVRSAADSGIDVIAIEARRTLILEIDDVADLCRSRSISLVALEDEDAGDR